MAISFFRHRSPAVSPLGETPETGHRDPRYRGLYLPPRMACEGAACLTAMYRGGTGDLDTLYPEDLSHALGRLSTLKEDSYGLRKGRRRLSNRDLARLAQMETEIASLEKRLSLHGTRVRGAHLALAEALGHGWKEYLLGLGSLLFFLERTCQAMSSRRRMAADPGRSSKIIVKGLDDALWQEMEKARELASRITPPEGLDGQPAPSAKPLLIYLTRPARRQRLLELSQNIIDSLESARTAVLDLLLATEDRLREMAASSPEALKAIQAMPPGRTPEIPELPDPNEGAGSPYVPPEDRMAAPDAGPDGGASGGISEASASSAGPGTDTSDASSAGTCVSPAPDGSGPSGPGTDTSDASRAGPGASPMPDGSGPAGPGTDIAGSSDAFPAGTAASPIPDGSVPAGPGTDTDGPSDASPAPDGSGPAGLGTDTADTSDASPAGTDASPAGSAALPPFKEDAAASAADPGSGNASSPAASAALTLSNEDAVSAAGSGSGAASASSPAGSGPEPGSGSAPSARAAVPSPAVKTQPGPHEVTHTPQDIPAALRRLAAASAGAGLSGGVPEAPAYGWAPAPSKARADAENGEKVPSHARTPMRTLLFVCVGLALALAATCARKELFPPIKETSVYVFNGLGTGLTVSLDGKPSFLAPGDRLERRVEPGAEFRIEAVTEQGSVVERLFAGAPRDGSSLVYSVAGAAPFVEWTANYGQEPGGSGPERILGALRIFPSRADYVLTLPPGTLKLKGGSGTRLSLNPLSGVHPEMMLDVVTPEARRRLIRTHARWEAPDQAFLPLWLSLAVAQDGDSALKLLTERLSERPGDIWTLRELLLALAQDEREDVCRDIRLDAAEYPLDPGLAYLEVLCVPDPTVRAGMVRELSGRFPDYPFVTRALGMVAFREGDTAKALKLLRKAFAEDPRVMLLDIDLLARLSRLEGLTQAEILAEIGPWSPATRRLAEAEISNVFADVESAYMDGHSPGSPWLQDGAEADAPGGPEGSPSEDGPAGTEGSASTDGSGGPGEPVTSDGSGGQEASQSPGVSEDLGGAGSQAASLSPGVSEGLGGAGSQEASRSPGVSEGQGGAGSQEASQSPGVSEGKGRAGSQEGATSPDGSGNQAESASPDGTTETDGSARRDGTDGPEGASGPYGPGGSESSGGSEGAEIPEKTGDSGGSASQAGTSGQAVSEGRKSATNGGGTDEPGGSEVTAAREGRNAPETAGIADEGRPDASGGATAAPKVVQNPELALRLLHLGRPEEALDASPEPFRRDMLLLAAASDGAGPDLVRKWREEFRPGWLNERNAWCDWALSVREGADRYRAEDFITASTPSPDLSRMAFWLILEGDWTGLKDVSRGLDPRIQGELALAHAIVWGADAPEECRHMAKSYLYIGERPYLE
ncbi:MAG: hypothetical protein LBT40_09325 [Deltaproteobacteria bacterium]|jgi:hypothetical protein|nr:hypothetical protein [Deltaproteobacteria bacterium]